MPPADEPADGLARPVIGSRTGRSMSSSSMCEPSCAFPIVSVRLDQNASNDARMRSPVTSRSNWAKDKRTFRVNRPILVVVLNN